MSLRARSISQQLPLISVSLTYVRRCQIIFDSYNGIQIWKKISIASDVLGNMRTTVISSCYQFKYIQIQENSHSIPLHSFFPFSLFLPILLRLSRQFFVGWINSISTFIDFNFQALNGFVPKEGRQL